MSPKHKLTTMLWCAFTMATTLVISSGHLIMKEILRNWPRPDSWEGRFEAALYTQGGLALLASAFAGVAIMVRGWIVKQKDEDMARRELIQREKHHRAEQSRHEALLGAIAALAPAANETDRDSTTENRSNGSSQETTVKKSFASGAKPR